MSQQDPSKKLSPEFLKELAPDAVMYATVFNGPVNGKEAITKVVETIADMFTSFKPLFMSSAGGRDFVEYEAGLHEGMLVRGLVELTRGNDKFIQRVDVFHSPLDAVTAIASKLSGESGK